MTTETLESLRHIVELTFGQHVRSMRSLTSGTVNQTVRFHLEDNRQFILRVAPGPVEADAGPTWLTANGLRREQTAIALLRQLGGILPETVASDFSGGSLGRDWVIQSIISGVPVSTVQSFLSPSDTHRIWRDLGDIAARIHSVTGIWFGPPSDGPRFPTWSDLVLDDIRGFRSDAERWNLATDRFDTLTDLVESARLELNAIAPTLIHSDLSLDHVFVAEGDPGWRISGLIDLEFARFADPVSEGLLLDLLPRSDPRANAFFAGYGGRPDISPIRTEIATRLIDAWIETDRARLTFKQSSSSRPS